MFHITQYFTNALLHFGVRYSLSQLCAVSAYDIEYDYFTSDLHYCIVILLVFALVVDFVKISMHYCYFSCSVSIYLVLFLSFSFDDE